MRSIKKIQYHMHERVLSFPIVIKYVLQIYLMKLEIEFKTGAVSASQISQKLGTILDSVKQQGLDNREFSIEMDIGDDGGTQFPKKISAVFDSMEQQDLKAKECELEINTQSTGDVAQATQKISSIVNTINEQGFEVKEIEVDAEKNE
ncbi:MAG: hypothetical protein L0H55_16340 [Candidatus Nitrosocosmicus sp.]|nr:hypothetical protein [Candidatus Nitrosocosmicus sp.]